MSLIVIVLVLAFFGFLCWIIFQFTPLPSPWSHVICGVIGFFVLVWLLQTLGVNTGPLPHIRLW